MNKKLVPPLLGTGISTILLCFTGIEWTGRIGLDPRNLALMSELASCPSREIVGGDIRVGYTLDGNIVFDVRSCKEDSRVIDPLHLLLQFGNKIKGNTFQYLSMASGGEVVYRLEKSDLVELAREYELGAQIWAIDHWPERLRKPTGEKAFESWSGGIFGVLQAQLEDLNKGLKAWLHKADTV